MNTKAIKTLKQIIAIFFSLLVLGFISYTIINFMLLKANYRMEQVIFIYAIIIVASLLACILFCSAIEKSKYKRMIKITTLSVIFSYYCFLLIYLLFLSRSFMYIPIESDGLLERIRRNTTLIPFRTIHTYLDGALKGERIAITNLLGNLLAFMPMAFFLPTYLKKLKKLP